MLCVHTGLKVIKRNVFEVIWAVGILNEYVYFEDVLLQDQRRVEKEKKKVFKTAEEN